MIRKFLASVFIFTAVTALAQEASYSPYSIHGLGLRRFKGTVPNIAMGNTITSSDPVSPNILNPASYGELKVTYFGIGATYSSATIKSNTGESSGKATTFDYLSFAIPTNHFGFGFGLVPYTATGYRINEQNDAGEKQSRGTGGVNRVYLGLGSKSYKGLKFGAELQYNFGRLENETTQINDDIDEVNVSNVRNLDQTNVSGFSYTFSTIYDLLIKEKYNFRATLNYELSSKINSFNTREKSEISENGSGQNVRIGGTEQLLDVDDRKFNLPSRVTIGLGFSESTTNKWNAVTEIYFGKNKDYRDRIEDREGVVYKDPFGFKLGGHYQPNYQSLTNYLGRIIYRAGLRYENLGLQINNSDITEFGMSFGMSLPLSNGFSSLDIAGEFGRRGVQTDILVKENFFNISLGLSLTDRWFKKRKYD